MLDLNSLREKMKTAENKAKNGKQSGLSNLFPWNNLKAGDSVRIRFIQDNDQNPVFWRERRTRVLPFNTVKQANGEIVPIKAYVDIPAFNSIWNETLYSEPSEEYIYDSKDDVIQKKISSFWNMGEEGRKLYRTYSRKKYYVFQGFVRSEGYEANKLYRFIINEPLFTLIEASLKNPEIETMPADTDKGLDLIVNVTTKGNYNDYSTSTWSRKETSLTDEEKAVAETSSLTLKDYIFKRPTVEQEQAMIEMFEASINNEPYDVTRWGKMFKPNNVYFDADGNIRDTKNKSTEIPHTSSVQETVQNVINNDSEAPKKEEIPVSEPKVTATQLINQNSEDVSGSNPTDTIQQLMLKMGIQNNNSNA